MSEDYVDPGFRPTHVVPQDGLAAWEAPDVSRPTAPLDPFLPVQLLARRGEWAEIACANGWTAWVDGRLLVAVPQPPPTAGRPLSRSQDPRPLLTRATEALDRYSRAAQELAAGRMDRAAFRQDTRGLRIGVVVDGESVWLYDDAAGRWMYGEGTRLTTFATTTGPGGSPSAPDRRRSRTPAPQPPAGKPAPAAAAPPPGPGTTRIVSFDELDRDGDA
ncbi:hypothetical protein [Streptomyces sp. NPDC093225]|uniref:hypothetical protein n=1 Tax=Streptomyces sp. NPDC093225 TaxID=3366034 RepID=UPI0037F9716D